MSSNHSEIRAGLIGCGRIARVHVRHLKTLPHVRLVGVCDVDPERARAFAAEAGAAEWVSEPDELFRLGLLYSTGQGGAPLDYVSAHMLFNLAAMRGSEEAKRYRKELSAEMDRDMVAEAQRAAREWLQSA